MMIPPAPRPVWRTCLLLLLAPLLLAGCGRLDTPMTSAAQNLQTQATARPTPTLSSLDKTQQAIDERLAHEIQTAAARPTSQTPPPLPTNRTVPVQTGLTTDCESIYFRGLLVAKNCWLDLIDDHYLFVVAGSNADNPVEGKVGFYTVLPDGSFLSEFTDYTTPSQHGAVTITAVALPRFTLTAEDGTTFVFNVETRAWE